MVTFTTGLTWGILVIVGGCGLLLFDLFFLAAYAFSSFLFEMGEHAGVKRAGSFVYKIKL